jgi:hypothetical protein
MTQPALANRRFPFTGAPVDPLLLRAKSSSVARQTRVPLSHECRFSVSRRKVRVIEADPR